YQFNQVGTGPYRFVEYIPDERLVIRRNPAYAWGPSFYQPPAQGQIDEVEFRFFRDPATRLAALEQGIVQVMGEIPPGDARVLIGNTSFRIVSTTVAGQPDQLLMNTARPPLDNRSFRQILLLGTNRAAIVDSLYQGFANAAEGVVTTGTQFYNPVFSGLYPFDLQQARALMSTLGYVDADNNGYLDTPDGDLTLTMIVPPWGEYRQVAQFLQDQWGNLGIGLNLVSVPDFPTLLSEVGEGEYHLVPFNSYGVDPAFLSTYYTTEGTRNFTGYSDPNLDALLFEARRQLDPAVRGEFYSQAQTLMAEQALILPLRDRVNLTGVSARVENLQYDSYGWYPILYNASYQP
ncbi:MAG: ABC transporter substrate-binding protein, partial [Anaerolineae bacterium]|nr:ABC transporter substrate-binding protein [Anaerolineae bacterium]